MALFHLNCPQNFLCEAKNSKKSMILIVQEYCTIIDKTGGEVAELVCFGLMCLIARAFVRNLLKLTSEKGGTSAADGHACQCRKIHRAGFRFVKGKKYSHLGGSRHRR